MTKSKVSELTRSLSSREQARAVLARDLALLIRRRLRRRPVMPPDTPTKPAGPGLDSP